MLRKERLKEFKISFMKLNNNNSNNDTIYVYPAWNYFLFHINNTLVFIILNFLYKKSVISKLMECIKTHIFITKIFLILKK